MRRQTASTAKPLPLAERKASVARLARTATGKAKAGMKLIDYRPPTARERAFADTLAPRARQILAGKTARRAA
jgi:hypothetical protein